MAPRRFNVDVEPETEPLQFVLEGKQTDGLDWSEMFTVLPELPPGALLDLAGMATFDDDGAVQWSRTAVLRFLRAVIVPDDETRFDALMRDKERMVEFNKLGAVMFFITEDKSARPTGPRPSSPDGSRNGQTGSEAVSSSAPATDESTI